MMNLIHARNHSQSVMNPKNLQQYKKLAPHGTMIQANSNGVAENESNLIPANSSKVVCVYKSGYTLNTHVSKDTFEQKTCSELKIPFSHRIKYRAK